MADFLRRLFYRNAEAWVTYYPSGLSTIRLKLHEAQVLARYFHGTVQFVGLRQPR